VVEEELAARIVRDETGDLDDRRRAALRYADAHMTVPRLIDEPLVRELHARFTTEELVELTFDVSAWNLQKVAVALGTDAPVDDGGLAALGFDEHGRTVYDRPD
jgi:alkylhydroperoxidase family enzyme